MITGIVNRILALRIWRIAVFAAFGLIAISCAVDQPPERQLAEAVRTQYPDLIVEMHTTPGNFLDPPRISYVVAVGADVTLVREIACTATPASAAQLAISQLIEVEARTADHSFTVGGTTRGCEP